MGTSELIDISVKHGWMWSNETRVGLTSEGAVAVNYAINVIDVARTYFDEMVAKGITPRLAGMTLLLEIVEQAVNANLLSNTGMWSDDATATTTDAR